MAARVHVKKGDTVRILSGVDAGKEGEILEVIPSSERVVVDGVSIVKRHTRPTQTNPQGGVVESPAAIPASKVMVVCPSCGSPSRVNRDRAEDGTGARVCKRCGKTID